MRKRKLVTLASLIKKEQKNLRKKKPRMKRSNRRVKVAHKP
jgi:hypothetical protein